MRMTEQEFDEMTRQNPSLRVSENSAHKGAVSGSEDDKWDKIRATENQLGKASRKKSVKKKSKGAGGGKTNQVDITPHARALAYLARHPDDIEGKREHYCQTSIFDCLEKHHPDIYLLTAAIPNSGKRPKATAGQMQAEGQKKGYPDMTIDAARGVYHGFRLELKIKGNYPSKEQKAYHEALRAEGYCVIVAWEFDAAMKAILEYWNLNPNERMSAEQYK